MSHDVFISHSSLDKLAADAVCHGLEANGIRCWIAPRDQIAGRPYGEQITSAIETAQVVVLVFSDNVNRSQAVLNEINIAAGANRTIVPFRLAQVEFNPELHFYLGRMHWLDAFPQPIDAYIDALVSTVRRNLQGEPAQPATAARPSQPTPPEPVLAPQVAPSPAQPVPAPPPQPAPAQAAAASPAPAAQVPAAASVAPKTDMRPLAIIGAVVGVVTLIVLVVALSPHPTPAPLSPAANAIEGAVVNKVVASLNEADKPDAADNEIANATASPGAAQPGRGDGAELTPVSAANPAMVNYFETQVAPNGPPQFLAGATVINTQQLLSSMRDRDAGGGPFWLIDARGCGVATIPTAACLGVNNIVELEAKVPNRQTQLVFFCLDGGCPMSYQAASAALAAGYSNVFWYRGGVSAWAAAGEPVAPAAGATL
jgi:rhodanese-related sulfurtransferase